MSITDELLAKVENHKNQIGELLVKHTSLTKTQLSEALEIQKNDGSLLGEILM